MKGRIFGLFFVIFAMFMADVAFAQARARASSNNRGASAKARSPTPTAPAVAQTQQAVPAPSQTPAAPAPVVSPAPAGEQESSEVPFVADCALHFNLCMDNICGDQFRSRANCSETIDSFETVSVLNQKIRVGRDLYDFAKGSCLGAFTNCPLAERNRVETAYKIQIQSDVVNKAYAEAMAYTGEEAAKEALAEYVKCMAPLCGGQGFPQCSTIAEVDRRAPKCEDILKKTDRPLAVRRDFLDTLMESVAESCVAGGGSVDYESKKCGVKVEFGMPEIVRNGKQRMATGRMTGSPLASRTFMVGETVECTQEYFSITHKVNHQEKQAKTKTGFGIGKLILGQAAIVGGIVLSIFGGAGAPLIGAGISMSGSGTADIIDGHIMKESGDREGGCFINGKLVVPLGNFFRVGLMGK